MNFDYEIKFDDDVIMTIKAVDFRECLSKINLQYDYCINQIVSIKLLGYSGLTGE